MGNLNKVGSGMYECVCVGICVCVCLLSVESQH